MDVSANNNMAITARLRLNGVFAIDSLAPYLNKRGLKVPVFNFAIGG